MNVNSTLLPKKKSQGTFYFLMIKIFKKKQILTFDEVEAVGQFLHDIVSDYQIYLSLEQLMISWYNTVCDF